MEIELVFPITIQDRPEYFQHDFVLSGVRDGLFDEGLEESSPWRLGRHRDPPEGL